MSCGRVEAGTLCGYSETYHFSSSISTISSQSYARENPVDTLHVVDFLRGFFSLIGLHDVTSK